MKRKNLATGLVLVVGAGLIGFGGWRIYEDSKIRKNPEYPTRVELGVEKGLDRLDVHSPYGVKHVELYDSTGKLFFSRDVAPVLKGEDQEETYSVERKFSLATSLPAGEYRVIVQDSEDKNSRETVRKK